MNKHYGEPPDDSIIDEHLQRAPGPRVTEEVMRQKIKCTNYYVFPDTTVTVCCIELTNGFSVVGHSGCVSKANFDSRVGEALAYKDAFSHLWALEGYLLAEHMHVRNVQ